MRQNCLRTSGLALLMLVTVTATAAEPPWGPSPAVAPETPYSEPLTLQAFEVLFGQAQSRATAGAIAPKVKRAAGAVWKSLHHGLVDVDARIQDRIVVIQANEGADESLAIRELISDVAHREQIIVAHYRELERILVDRGARGVDRANTDSDPERDLYRSGKSTAPASIRVRFELEDLQQTEVD